MKKTVAFLILLIVIGIGLAIWLRRERKLEHPNIVLVTIDTLRSDHCSAYGYSRNTTPNMNRIAKEGCRFEMV
jgi:glucan phosphoethanolaminetransferase (alkaline phosphatase superfamily)